MKINKKILIFAISIGILTTYGLYLYINNIQNIQKNQDNYSNVIIANNTIPANSKITADMVTMKSIPTEYINSEAITSMDKIVNEISKDEIVKGEQILSSRIINDTTQNTLQYKIPQNMRAISIPASEISAVGGYINVGDKIDILVTYANKEVNPVSTTYTQLQNIEVAAVGNAKLSEEDKKKALPTSITVFVSPAQAEVIAYAVLNGNMFITLRNPIDSKRIDLNFYNGINFSTYNER